MPKQDKRVEKYETKKGIRYRFKTYVAILSSSHLLILCFYIQL